MGVDARILIKIINPDSWLSVEDLRLTASHMTKVLGAENFFLQPDENRHALSFVQEEMNKWAEKYPDDYPDYDPEGPAVYQQDGDDIVAEPNEQFIEVHLSSRYYGEDYARGDWKTLFFVMLWVIYNIKNSEVWYGGDSSGIEAELMTQPRLGEMTKFYLTDGHDSYRSYFHKHRYTCGFCNAPMGDTGGGGDIEFYHCDGCNGQWVLQRDGALGPCTVTYYDRYGADRDIHDGPMVSFTLSDQVKAGTRKMYPFDGIFRHKYPHVPALAAPKKAKKTKKGIGSSTAKLLTTGEG